MEHKEVRDRILDILNDRRGEKHPTASKVRSSLDDFNIDLNTRQIDAYLDELITEGLVKRKLGKSFSHQRNSIAGKSKTVRGKNPDTYFISEKGIAYILNGYKKPELKSEVLDAINHTNSLLERILENSSLTVEEQQKHNQLLSQLKEALYDQDDSKARKILKEALDVGKQIAIPLFIEYLKGFVKGQN